MPFYPRFLQSYQESSPTTRDLQNLTFEKFAGEILSSQFVAQNWCRESQPLSHAQGCRPQPSRRLFLVLSVSSLLFPTHFKGQRQELRPRIRACLAARFSSHPHETTQRRETCLQRRVSKRRRSCWAGRVIT